MTTTLGGGHINRLIALENDKAQEALVNYSAYLKVADDMIYFLSREFVDTIKNENNIFRSFFTQISVDLELAVLSTLRRHDIQACFMLRHALESICLATYASVPRPVADEPEILADFGNTTKAYGWIKNEFPKHSENIKKIKGKINENFSHTNIKTAAPNLIFQGEKIKSCFFDSNSNKIIPGKLYVISEIAWLALDLLDKAIKSSNGGIILNEGLIKE